MFGRIFARKKQRFVVNEFTIFGVFIAVAVFGILYGLLLAVTGALPTEMPADFPDLQPVVAPTESEYQSEASDVLSPFFRQAAQMQAEDLTGDTGALLQLVQKTQDRLLRVRVPKEYRDAHLSFVLLLDQWKRALAGSAPDRKVVLDKTRELMAANPWLQL
ncbi:MAG: hypothetical protein RL272_99 [Candidatus Parcubacteria bacterium]|jgi:hypothetical protein